MPRQGGDPPRGVPGQWRRGHGAAECDVLDTVAVQIGGGHGRTFGNGHVEGLRSGEQRPLGRAWRRCRLSRYRDGLRLRTHFSVGDLGDVRRRVGSQAQVVLEQPISFPVSASPT